MSDIHGCIAEFEHALSMVTGHLGEEDTMLILLGDYMAGMTAAVYLTVSWNCSADMAQIKWLPLWEIMKSLC